MEWRIHAIVLRTPGVARSLDNPKEEEDDPGMQISEGGHAVEQLRDLVEPRMVGAACRKFLSVLRFEGEEDKRYETTDLPATENPLAPNESPTPSNEFPCVEKSSPPYRECVEELLSCVEGESPPADCQTLLQGSQCEATDSSAAEIAITPIDFHVGEKLSDINTPSRAIFLKSSSVVEREENRAEIMDLLVAECLSAPNHPSIAKTFDPALKTMYQYNRVEKLPPNVVIPLAGCEKFSEWTKDASTTLILVKTRYDASITNVAFLAYCLFGTYGKVQVVVENTRRDGRLTKMTVAHLVRPPGDDGGLMNLKLSSRACLLIALLIAHRACHMLSAQPLIYLFWMALDA
jgi:hypothetical protein